MAEFFECLNDKLIAFIEAQPMFFISSAAAEGRINLSPKGLDTFRVISPRLCVYLDITGSGNETAAHAKAGGRATVMFCSFTRNPLVLRLFGRTRNGAPGSCALAGIRRHCSKIIPAPARSSPSMSNRRRPPAASACRRCR